MLSVNIGIHTRLHPVRKIGLCTTKLCCREMEDQSELRDEKLMHEHTFEYDEAVTKFANGRYQLFIYGELFS